MKAQQRRKLKCKQFVLEKAHLENGYKSRVKLKKRATNESGERDLS